MTRTKTKNREAEPALFPGEAQPDAKDAAKAVGNKRQQAKPPAKVEKKNEVVPFEPKPTNLLVVFARAASDPKCDTQKMRELKEMMSELKREEAEVAFTEAYIAMRAELPTIDKDGMIDHGEGTTRSGGKKQKTRYSTYENIMEIVQPILTKHKFMLTALAKPQAGGAGVSMFATLSRVHETQYGRTVHKISDEMDVPPEPSGSKNPVQALGSARSYAKRYTTISVLGIISRAPQDRDRDGYAPPAEVKTITEEQQKKLLAAVDDCGIEPTRFFEKYKIDKVGDLAADKFADAMKSCENYKAEAQRRGGKAQAQS